MFLIKLIPISACDSKSNYMLYISYPYHISPVGEATTMFYNYLSLISVRNFGSHSLSACGLPVKRMKQNSTAERQTDEEEQADSDSSESSAGEDSSHSVEEDEESSSEEEERTFF